MGTRIRELILSGDLDPGSRLPTERELGGMLGVSRGSVREAIRELAALGIVETRQGSGTYIRPIDGAKLFAPLDFTLRVDPGSLLHLFELRRCIEPAAASLAAARGSEAAFASLEVEWDAYVSAFTRNAWPELAAIDLRIHAAVAAASGNPLIIGLLRSVADAGQRSRSYTADLPATHLQSRAELEALVRALRRRDSLGAEAAMTRHLARLEDDARRSLAEASQEHGR